MEFLYDPLVFSETATFDPKVIHARLRELAFLNTNASIHYKVQEEASVASDWTTLCYKGGLKEYVLYMNRGKSPLHEVISFEGEKSGVKVK